MTLILTQSKSLSLQPPLHALNLQQCLKTLSFNIYIVLVLYLQCGVESISLGQK